MAVVGGLGTTFGAVVGTVAVMLCIQLLTRLSTMTGMPEAAPTILSYAVYASMLVVAVLFVPEGLVPAVETWFGRRSVKRSASAE